MSSGADSPIVAIEPEGGRYAADLLLIHGLWCSSDVWQPVARAFAQRGWRCLLLEASGTAALPYAAWVAAAERTAGRLPARPAVLGHGAGGLIALALAERGLARAAIAVAPPARPPLSLLAWWERLRVRLPGASASPSPPPPLLREVASRQGAGRLATALRAEPAGRVRSFGRAGLRPGRPAVPTLLVAQEADTVVPALSVETAAARLGVDLLRLPGGHWALLEGRIDAWATQTHRWLIRRCGESLLLLRGDEDLAEG